MQINIGKTDDGINSAGPISGNEVIDSLTKDIMQLCTELMTDGSEFDAGKITDELINYIKNSKRILYTPISDFIYTCYDTHDLDTADQMMDNMISNIEKMLEYVNSDDYKSKIAQAKGPERRAKEDAQKTVLKMWDHANLAKKQYFSLKQTDTEFKSKFDEKFSSIFDKSFKASFDESFKTSFEQSMAPEKEKLNAQLITMVGIFTALAFLVFGGISSLDNIFSNSGISILRLMIVGSVWGLCILNMVFVFMICVGKMTDLNFKSTQDKSASIFRKYPIVWWSDFVILFLLAGSVWLYYLQSRNGLGWLDMICQNTPVIFSIAGTVVLLAVSLIVALILAQYTKHVPDGKTVYNTVKIPIEYGQAIDYSIMFKNEPANSQNTSVTVKKKKTTNISGKKKFQSSRKSRGR